LEQQRPHVFQFRIQIAVQIFGVVRDGQTKITGAADLD
jgi:hypothetical protein